MEPTNVPPWAVVDIDGVLADVRHRLRFLQRRPKDWNAFFRAAPDDPAHPEGLAVAARLAEDHDVVLLTGRPERCRADTLAWLARHDVRFVALRMRDERDRRPAARLKVDVLRALARERPIAVMVDDDPAVLAAVSAAGFPTYHAAWEARAAAMDEAQEREGRT
jgi:phosphoglycolate phosphatase-like HAD superfamily hydrolase